jgi:hypothetical protein
MNFTIMFVGPPQPNQAKLLQSNATFREAVLALLAVVLSIPVTGSEVHFQMEGTSSTDLQPVPIRSIASQSLINVTHHRELLNIPEGLGSTMVNIFVPWKRAPQVHSSPVFLNILGLEGISDPNPLERDRSNPLEVALQTNHRIAMLANVTTHIVLNQRQTAGRRIMQDTKEDMLNGRDILRLKGESKISLRLSLSGIGYHSFIVPP